jgi:chloride channel protein, CIC family
LLLISACVGGAVGEIATRAFPGLHVSPGAFALVAMAATFGAATRATFASIVFVFELTRDYDAILPLMLATVIADLAARKMLHDSLMTEKLSRRGLRVPTDFHADVLRSVDVAEVMTRDVTTMRADLRLAEAVDEFRRGGHGAYPVVDADGRCVGIISRSDLLAADLPDDAPLSDIAHRDVVTADASEPVISALERMLEERVEHLPVLDSGRHVIGICTRTDVLSARQRHFALDRRQDGWLRALT